MTQTPKEAYEARKAAHQARQERPHPQRQADTEAEVFDLVDRFVTAIERIAEVYTRTGGR